MWIGAARIVMDFYNNSDLRVKRKNMDELIADLRKRFNVSAFEVAEFEDLEKCVLGVSVVMPESWSEPKAREFLRAVIHEVDTTSFARVVADVTELYALE